MNINDRLQQFFACIEIAHHIPGRIRLRLSDRGLLAIGGDNGSLLARASELKETFGRIPGVRSLRVNLLARSCTIEYDSSAIQPQAWADLLGQVRSDAATALQQIILDNYVEVSQT